METNEPNPGEGESAGDDPEALAPEPAPSESAPPAAGTPAEHDSPGGGPAAATSDGSPVDDDEDGGASRRVLIDLAVRRRDDLTPQALLRVLATLDVEVDAETLAGDLERLDIKSVTLPDGRVVLRHDDDGEGAADGTGSDAADPAVADVEGFYPSEAERPFRNPKVLAGIGAGVLVVLIVVLVLAFSGGKKNHDTTTAAGGQGAKTTTTTSGGTGKGTGTGKGKGKGKVKRTITPIGTGPDPALSLKTDKADLFSTNGIGLGTYPTIGPWVVGSGTWAVLGQQATLVKPTAGQPSLAYVDVHTANLRAQVRISGLGPGGAGLAFRVVDAKNFWLWTVAPPYSSVFLAHVVNGKETVVYSAGLVRLPVLAVLLGVDTSGSKIQLLIEGKVVKTLTDSTAKPGQGLGIGSFSKTKGASFDNMVFKAGA